MALNKDVFRIRTISALIFAVVMVAAITWSPWTFLLLFAVIHWGCWVEYLRLLEKIYQTAFDFLVKAGFILTGFGWYFYFCGPHFQVNGYALKQLLGFPMMLAGFLVLAIGILRHGSPLNTKALGSAAMGLVYISLSWGLLLALRQDAGLHHATTPVAGWVYPMFLVASIWINDTMAYIVGSMVGKTPLTRISPKKTWEGTLGGIILAVGLMTAAAYYFEIPLTIGIGLAVIGAVVGTFGDLLESWLKRLAGVKDSGNMMPGHGGFLDRFDSLLLASPVAWGWVALMGL